MKDFSWSAAGKTSSEWNLAQTSKNFMGAKLSDFFTNA